MSYLALRRFFARLFGGHQSVDSILNQHRKTIDALHSQSERMEEYSEFLEEQIAKKKADLDKALLEQKRAIAAAHAMNKVFGVADEVTL